MILATAPVLVAALIALAYATYRRDIDRAFSRISTGSQVVQTPCGAISNGPAWRVPAGSRSPRPAPSALPAHANCVRVLPRATPVRSETPTAAAVQHARPSTAAGAPD